MKKISPFTNLLAIAFMLIGFSSCTKQDFVEVAVEQATDWEIVDRFSYYDVTQMNAFATEEQLSFLGTSGFSTLGHASQAAGAEKGEFVVYALHFTPPSTTKLPIGPNYFVGTSMLGSTVNFYGTDMPIGMGRVAGIDLKQIDPMFTSIQGVHFTSGESMAINTQNQSLIAYNVQTQPHNTSALRFLLVDINPGSDRNSEPLTVKSSKIIAIDDVQYGLLLIAAIGDNFLVSSGEKTYLINSDGNSKEVLQKPISRVFSDKGILYAVNRRSITTSKDGGNTWVDLDNQLLRLDELSFTHVGNQLVGYRYGQIWKINIGETGYEVEELENHMLHGKAITSIAEFDGKVYVATLSGVFSKPVEKFFDAKDNDNG